MSTLAEPVFPLFLYTCREERPDRHYVDRPCTKIYRTETIIYIKLSSQHTSLSLN